MGITENQSFPRERRPAARKPSMHLHFTPLLVLQTDPTTETLLSNYGELLRKLCQFVCRCDVIYSAWTTMQIQRTSQSPKLSTNLSWTPLGWLLSTLVPLVGWLVLLDCYMLCCSVHLNVISNTVYRLLVRFLNLHRDGPPLIQRHG